MDIGYRTSKGDRLETERLVFVQERFFTVESICHHEVTFFYLMKEDNVAVCSGANSDQKNERLYWVDIEELEDINLVPKFLITALKNIPDKIIHIISYD